MPRTCSFNWSAAATSEAHAGDVQSCRRRMGHGIRGSSGCDSDSRPPASPQPRGDNPRRQLSAARETPQRASAKTCPGATNGTRLMVRPTFFSLMLCSLPSSTLRAGYAGGLRPCLTAAVRDIGGKPGRGRETVPTSRTEKLHRGSVPRVVKGPIPDVAGQPRLIPRLSAWSGAHSSRLSRGGGNEQC